MTAETHDTGVLFKGPMVLAMLRGDKRQTRRSCKSQPYLNGYQFDGHEILCHNDYLPPSAMLMDCRRGGIDYTTSDLEGWTSECPYGQPGDQIWVRETYFAWGRWETRFNAKKGRDEWHFVDMTLDVGKAYAHAVADPLAPTVTDSKRGGVLPGWWRRPAIFMPRAACRLRLRIEDVRIEQLQEISEADAIAEGIDQQQLAESQDRYDTVADHNMVGRPTAVSAYRDLWCSINGTGAWDSNPWVWAVSFIQVLEASAL